MEDLKIKILIFLLNFLNGSMLLKFSHNSNKSLKIPIKLKYKNQLKNNPNKVKNNFHQLSLNKINNLI